MDVTPRTPDGADSFGAYWNVPVGDANAAFNFIVHNGDNKDPDADLTLTLAEPERIHALPCASHPRGAENTAGRVPRIGRTPCSPSGSTRAGRCSGYR